MPQRVSNESNIAPMKQQITLAAFAAALAVVLLEEAVVGLLKSLIPAVVRDAILTVPGLLTVAVLLLIGAIWLLWSVAREVKAAEIKARDSVKRALEATAQHAALAESHRNELERVWEQQERLTKLIDDAISKLDQLDRARDRSVQEIATANEKHLDAAAERARQKIMEGLEAISQGIQNEMRDWKFNADKAVREEFGDLRPIVMQLKERAGI